MMTAEMMTAELVALTILLAAFIQGASGFGFGLVSMPLLASLIDVRMAAPLVAMISVVSNISMCLYYRREFDVSAVIKLFLASCLTIPIGVTVLSRLNQDMLLALLGVIVIGYALYALLSLQLPSFTSSRWAFVFGGLSGLLTGAYNTGGPPVVIYGNCCQWNPQQFKGNIQGFFLLNLPVVLFMHAQQGNITPSVWRLVGYSLPGLVLGVVIGTVVSERLDPIAFQRVILVLLMILGVRLIISAI